MLGLIRMFPKIMKAYSGKECIPLRVSHLITNRCNRKCVYCPVFRRKSRELKTDEIKDLMSEFKKRGTVSWGFTGGEPFIREDIGELVDHAKNLSFHISLNTNGFMFRENLDILKKIDLITLSLDGDKGINDKLRGKGSYSDIISALNFSKENQIEPIIFLVISKPNTENEYQGLRHVLDLARKFSVKINIQPVDYYDDIPNKKFYLSKKELSDAIDFILNLDDLNDVISTSKATLSHFREQKEFECFAGRFFIVLHPDGKISPCVFKQKKELTDKIKFDVKKCKCQTNCIHEYNLLFNWNIPVLINLMRNYV